MKNKIIYVFPAMMVFLFIFASAHSQEDMTVVDNSVFHNPQRVPSLFDHDKHNEAAGIDDCSECHHVYEDGKKVDEESSEDQSCSECHGMKASGNKPALRKAFHTNCIGCHLSQKKGPIMCGECHKK